MGDMIDIVAVVVRIQPVTTFILKSSGQPKERRTVTLMDSSGKSCDMTLWGADCACVDAPEGFLNDQLIWIIVGKKIKIGSYQGLTQLSPSMGALIETFPYSLDKLQWITGKSKLERTLVPEIDKLMKWYMREGKDLNISSPPVAGKYDDKRLSIAEIIDVAQSTQNNVNIQRSGLWFTCVASVIQTHIGPGKKFFWTACPVCTKKVIPTGGDEGEFGGDVYNYGAGKKETQPTDYYCGSCGKTVATPDRRYMVPLDIQDHTESLKCTILADPAMVGYSQYSYLVVQALLGVRADEIENARIDGKGPNGEDWMDYFCRLRRKEFVFRIKAQSETWQDESRIVYVGFLNSLDFFNCRKSLLLILSRNLHNRNVHIGSKFLMKC